MERKKQLHSSDPPPASISVPQAAWPNNVHAKGHLLSTGIELQITMFQLYRIKYLCILYIYSKHWTLNNRILPPEMEIKGIASGDSPVTTAPDSWFKAPCYCSSTKRFRSVCQKCRLRTHMHPTYVALQNVAWLYDVYRKRRDGRNLTWCQPRNNHTVL